MGGIGFQGFQELLPAGDQGLLALNQGLLEVLDLLGQIGLFLLKLVSLAWMTTFITFKTSSDLLVQKIYMSFLFASQLYLLWAQSL